LGKTFRRGQEQQGGWLINKYGISWQIILIEFIKLIQDTDAEKSRRVMDAMLQMKKLDMKILKQAYEGK
jgi:predicted 3-demethylubiquinone-9 3-methyltransferase (glyoxalase superfamily)